MRFGNSSALRAVRKGRWPVTMEQLESRTLMSFSFGANVIVDPGGESVTGSVSGNDLVRPITGWTPTGDFTVAVYGSSGVNSTTVPNGGKNYFAGGPDGAVNTATQVIDLKPGAAGIGGGGAKFTLSGYLGGWSSQDDNAMVSAAFRDVTGHTISTSKIGPATPTDRKNTTEFVKRSLTGSVPANAASVLITITMTRASGSYNDGYADNLSLVLTSGPVGATGTVSGTVYNDINGNGAKEAGDGGLAGVKVFIDANHNGVFNTGEPSAITSAAGQYNIAKLTPGAASVRVVVPATYRATTANPASVTLTAGGTSTANFGLSQTVLIAGNIFNDANGNGKRDAGEAALAGATVYLDFNNNGQLDSFELSAKTDSQGNYKFIVPFGSYVIREINPSGFTKSSPASIPLTLAKGQTSLTNNFADRH